MNQKISPIVKYALGGAIAGAIIGWLFREITASPVSLMITFAAFFGSLAGLNVVTDNRTKWVGRIFTLFFMFLIIFQFLDARAPLTKRANQVADSRADFQAAQATDSMGLQMDMLWSLYKKRDFGTVDESSPKWVAIKRYDHLIAVDSLEAAERFRHDFEYKWNQSIQRQKALDQMRKEYAPTDRQVAERDEQLGFEAYKFILLPGQKTGWKKIPEGRLMVFCENYNETGQVSRFRYRLSNGEYTDFSDGQSKKVPKLDFSSSVRIENQGGDTIVARFEITQFKEKD